MRKLFIETSRDVKLTRNEISILKKSNLEKLIKIILKGELKRKDNEKDIYISIYITDNDTIKKYNKMYRNKNKKTDVISFAYQESEEAESNFKVLGDIILSIEQTREQSLEYKNTLDREIYYLICHSVLHLLGYDHMNEKDKKIMRTKEEKYLKQFREINER